MTVAPWGRRDPNLPADERLMSNLDIEVTFRLTDGRPETFPVAMTLDDDDATPAAVALAANALEAVEMALADAAAFLDEDELAGAVVIELRLAG